MGVVTLFSIQRSNEEMLGLKKCRRVVLLTSLRGHQNSLLFPTNVVKIVETNFGFSSFLVIFGI